MRRSAAKPVGRASAYGPGMARNDLAIYTPGSSYLYESGDHRTRTGGAELQTKLLAETLVERGRSVAHIVYRLRSKPPPLPTGLVLVQREDLRGRPGRRQKLLEIDRVWRALWRADSRVYLFRGSSIQLVVGALFCRLRRRKLVFAAALDLDFDFERSDRSSWFLRLYGWALHRAAIVVVQTAAQRELAIAAGVDPDRLQLIRSFAEPAERATGGTQIFLWAGRLVTYKQPLEYLRLAAALPELEFVMVAAPTDETPTEIKEAIKEADRSLANLEVLGAVPREKVLELIERSVAVVSTSSHEGMPNVFLEGWARGVPSVSLSFDPDGLIERSGLGLACRGDWRGFVDAVGRLAQDEELRSDLSDRSRRYVAAEHSLDAVGRRWDELLGQLLAEAVD